MDVKLILGNSEVKLKDLESNSIDSIVTDPPYGLSFMGKKWDYDVPTTELWAECLRVLKPGGHLLAFAGTRTQHRMAVRIEDAGFEIRDMIAWVYGSGFPKSLNVSKAIDKARDDSADVLRVTIFIAEAAEAAGITRSDVDEALGTSDMAGWWLSRLQHRCQCPKWDQWLRLKEFIGFGNEMDAEVWRLNDRKGQPGEAWQNAEVIGEHRGAAPGLVNHRFTASDTSIRAATDTARQWEGWGTALKPALEPITLARKPLTGTVADNVLEHGTGALNIDGCRVEFKDEKDLESSTWGRGTNILGGNYVGGHKPYGEKNIEANKNGRWPANLIHDGSQDVLKSFPNAPGQQGDLSGHSRDRLSKGIYGDMKSARDMVARGDSGTAARFFYCAKASKEDREEGLSDKTARQNTHPTVKPTDLMRYLCRLITPPGGTILDPFMGSGSTGKGAILEGFSFTGIELSDEYMEIATARIKHAEKLRLQEIAQISLFT